VSTPPAPSRRGAVPALRARIPHAEHDLRDEALPHAEFSPSPAERAEGAGGRGPRRASTGISQRTEALPRNSGKGFDLIPGRAAAGYRCGSTFSLYSPEFSPLSAFARMVKVPLEGSVTSSSELVPSLPSSLELISLNAPFCTVPTET